MAEQLFEDDGTLACLHIPADESNKRFACKAERQENLIGKTFWLLDFFPEVQTRFGSRYLYKAAYDKDAPDSECFKVFTGSTDCGYILEIKPNWQIFPVEARGLDFLGYVFRHGYVLLRKRIKRNLFRALAHQRKVARNCREIRLAVGSYIGWLKYTNSKHLTNTLNNFCYGKVF